MPRTALDTSVVTLSTKLDTANSSIQSFSVSPFSLMNGAKNSWTTSFKLDDGPYSSIILDTSGAVANQYSLPASANTPVKIVSDNAGDDGVVKIYGVKRNGDSVVATVNLNGTSEVIIGGESPNYMCFVNNVVYDSETAILGTLTVSIQLNLTDWTEVGRFRNGVWANPRFLVPTGKKGCVLSFKGCNEAVGNSYIYALNCIRAWNQGSTQISGISKLSLFQNSQSMQEVISYPVIFNAGDLIYCYFASGEQVGQYAPSMNIIYVEYDE